MTAEKVVAFRPKVSGRALDWAMHAHEEQAHARAMHHWLAFAHNALVAGDRFRLNHALGEVSELATRHERRWTPEEAA